MARLAARITFAMAVLVFAATAHASSRATLRGVVLDPEGRPLEGLHVMVLDGKKPAPPFLIRPKAFGVPLPNVETVLTDADGRFAVPQQKAGAKTLLIGEEGLLLFGVAAKRQLDGITEHDVIVQLTAAELDDYRTLADRAEVATEAVEEVLVDLDLALGWCIEAKRKVDEAHAALHKRFFGDDAPEADESITSGKDESLLNALRERVRRLLPETP